MDNKNRQILNILQLDGRITNKAIAERVGLSTPAVLERIRKMERKDVILGYKAIINSEKVGKSSRAILAITLDRKYLDSFDEIKKSIRKCEFVDSYYFTTGKYDFFLVVSFKDIAELEDLLMKKIIVIIPSIKNIETFVVLSGDENLGINIPIEEEI